MRETRLITPFDTNESSSEKNKIDLEKIRKLMQIFFKKLEFMSFKDVLLKLDMTEDGQHHGDKKFIVQNTIFFEKNYTSEVAIQYGYLVCYRRICSDILHNPICQ